VEKYDISSFHANKSYSQYGTKRDETIKEILSEKKCDFFLHNDYLLVEPEDVEQRKVFTPFYKLWQKKISDTTEKSCPKFSSFSIEEHSEAKDFIKIEKHPYFTLEF
jgi:deoxyribodipyrimidine photolyase